MFSEEKVLEIVARSLHLSPGKVNAQTSAQTVEHWDSLAQLDILAKLDRESDGKSTHIPGLPMAFSVKDILENLKNAGLLTSTPR